MKKSTGTLQFEWTLGCERILQKSDCLVECANGYLCQVPITKFLCKTERIQQSGHTLFRGFYRLPSFLEQTREIYITPDQSGIRGEGKFVLSEKGTVALRFIFPSCFQLKIQGKGVFIQSTSQWRFISIGYDELILDGEASLPTFLLIKHVQKYISLKWSFHKE